MMRKQEVSAIARRGQEMLERLDHEREEKKREAETLENELEQKKQDRELRREARQQEKVLKRKRDVDTRDAGSESKKTRQQGTEKPQSGGRLEKEVEKQQKEMVRAKPRKESTTPPRKQAAWKQNAPSDLDEQWQEDEGNESNRKLSGHPTPYRVPIPEDVTGCRPANARESTHPTHTTATSASPPRCKESKLDRKPQQDSSHGQNHQEDKQASHETRPKAKPSPTTLPIYDEMMRGASIWKERTPRKPASSPTFSSSRRYQRPRSSPKPTTTIPKPYRIPKVTRSQSTPTFTPAQESLIKYISTWNELKRHEQGWPYPNPQLTEIGLLNRTSLGSTNELTGFSNTKIISLNAQLFFLKGNDLFHTLLVVGNEAKFVISSIRNSAQQIKALRAYLVKKELVRWHPDRMNLRTGVKGGEPDENLGALEVVAAVRTGVDELIERCEEAVLAGERSAHGR